MSYEQMNESRNMINSLKAMLEREHDRDPEQEVGSDAYRVIDATLNLAGDYFEGIQSLRRYGSCSRLRTRSNEDPFG